MFLDVSAAYTAYQYVTPGTALVSVNVVSVSVAESG